MFWRGQTAADGTVYPCIRIPSLVNAKGVLLAFAECRHRTGDGCNHLNYTADGPRDICMRRSTDSGTTWGPLCTLVRNSGQDTAVFDETTSTVVLNFNAESGNSQIVSGDLGLTWSRARFIGGDLGKYNGVAAGPGRGLQLSATNPHAPGRLLFIGHKGSYVQDVVWYSDDHGKSYKVSNTFTGTSLLQMDEAELVELENGNVLANMRNNIPSSTGDHYSHRGIALSTDGGTSFSKVVFDKALLEPVCMATVVRAAPPKGDGNVYFANPGQGKGRINGRIRRSRACTGLPPTACQWDNKTLVGLHTPCSNTMIQRASCETPDQLHAHSLFWRHGAVFGYVRCFFYAVLCVDLLR